MTETCFLKSQATFLKLFHKINHATVADGVLSSPADVSGSHLFFLHIGSGLQYDEENTRPFTVSFVPCGLPGVDLLILTNARGRFMLTHLSIKGLAIIDSLDITFGPGFNVITGETGAGKSILIKALTILLGGKIGHDVVRHGAEQAVVTGTFVVTLQHSAVGLLDELGIPLSIESKENQILVRRHVAASPTGKSLAWINDVAVTLSSLRRLGYFLIDIFGQHENQKLLNPAEHLHYLDQVLRDRELPHVVEKQYQSCQKQLRELEDLVASYKARARERDYIQFRVDEMRTFNPAADDYSRQRTLCDQFTNQAAIHEKLSQSQAILDSGASGQALSGALLRIMAIMADLSSTFPNLGILSTNVEPMIVLLDDLSYELEKSLSAFQIDEQEYEAAQDRLAEYQNLFRKLAVDSPDDLRAEFSRLEEELAFIDNAVEILRDKLRALHGATLELRQSCTRLTKERKKLATHICRHVEQEMNELGMKGAKFDTEFTPVYRAMTELDFTGFGHDSDSLVADIKSCLENTSASGDEKIQFLLSSNIGEPAKPLTRIASGGELSRIMLALKKVLTAGAETCVLVFDEIDAGISGRIADIVGKKMKELSRHFQIICISHLPQVAVHANKHLLVEKYQKKQKTESRIIPLGDEESAREIARLLSGMEITDQSIRNAKALVEKARML